MTDDDVAAVAALAEPARRELVRILTAEGVPSAATSWPSAPG
ncbi:hypothetical protein ACRAWC_19865 [Leifsonia sp. L25]